MVVRPLCSQRHGIWYTSHVTRHILHCHAHGYVQDGHVHDCTTHYISHDTAYAKVQQGATKLYTGIASARGHRDPPSYYAPSGLARYSGGRSTRSKLSPMDCVPCPVYPPISVSLVRCELSSVNTSTCLLLSARSAGVRPWLSRASSDAPASRRYAAHLVCPRTAAQCSGVRSPSASRALTLYPSASRACDRRPAGKRSRLGLLKSSPRVTLETP